MLYIQVSSSIVLVFLTLHLENRLTAFVFFFVLFFSPTYHIVLHNMCLKSPASWVGFFFFFFLKIFHFYPPPPARFFHYYYLVDFLKHEFEQQRNVELAEVQRLEEAERRKEEEKNRRVREEKLRVQREQDVAAKV